MSYVSKNKPKTFDPESKVVYFSFRCNEILSVLFTGTVINSWLDCIVAEVGFTL